MTRERNKNRRNQEIKSKGRILRRNINKSNKNKNENRTQKTCKQQTKILAWKFKKNENDKIHETPKSESKLNEENERKEN